MNSLDKMEDYDRLAKLCEKLANELLIERAKVSVLRKDADRYRWMSVNWRYAHDTIFFDGFYLPCFATLDEAIDAAMRLKNDQS